MFHLKRHLRYKSLDAWAKSEHVPCPITSIRDKHERDRRLRQYSELRDYLYRCHVRQLPREERLQLRAGAHPSQQTQDTEAAEAYARELEEQLRSINHDSEVTIGYRQGGILGLYVETPPGPSVDAEKLPMFFRGFWVYYSQSR